MNRIILIGNGFDLAHGFKTGYKDFIEDFWKRKIEKLNTNIDVTLEEDLYLNNNKSSNLCYSFFQNGKNLNAIKKNINQIGFKNIFLGNITKKSIDNWVDIENEYYELLKKSLQPGFERINELNKEFQNIQDELEKYLIEIENSDMKIFNNKIIINRITQIIKSRIDMKDFSETSISQLFLNIKKNLGNSKLKLLHSLREANFPGIENNEIELRKLINTHPNANYIFDQPLSNLLLLNFNYTSTDKFYSEDLFSEFGDKKNIINTETIHIHGCIKDKKNPIIFGFGDELDEKYKEIENKDNNEYLEFIKSMKYQNTSNYKRMLEFINSDNYQIFIFGHSCGLSDRTLLNTLFEHENCVSIKPYYYQFKDEKNNIKDNYSDIIKNISRNFNDKKSMREKVVNKEYCEPLIKVN